MVLVIPQLPLWGLQRQSLATRAVVLIFWGSEWTKAPPVSPTSDAIAAAIYRVLSGFFMMKLAQYRRISQGVLVAIDINAADPPVSFADSNVTDMIAARAGAGAVPSPKPGEDLIYAVIFPQRVGGASPRSSDHANDIGFHDFFNVAGRRAYWLWANNLGRLADFPSATWIYSHELVQTCSDAEFLGIRVQNDLGTGPEIADPCSGCGQSRRVHNSGLLVSC